MTTRHELGSPPAARGQLLPAITLLCVSMQLLACGNELVAWPPNDLEAPVVTSTVPSEGASAVAIDAMLSAVFSEPMNPSTLSEASFTLLEGTTPVPGTVSYIGLTSTFEPAADLRASTTYTATILDTAEDLAGNRLVAEHRWTFTTGSAPDNQPPQVTFTVPEDGATNAGIDASLLAVFSEAMDPASLRTSSFLLTQAGVAISGTVTSIGATAIFDPTDPLALDTEYEATLTTAASDLAGNALGASYVWTFTTTPALDPGPPRVIVTVPDDLEIRVPRDASIEATFSAPMDPRSTTSASFRVTGPGGASIAGVVGYDEPSHRVTLTPTRFLLDNTTYTATVTTEATDIFGIPLATDYVWRFSTGAPGEGNAGVNLRSLSTFVAVAGSGLTNSNSSGITTLGGDVGLSPTGTCLGDGVPCALTNPVITGTLYANDPEGIAATAKADLTAAYDDAMSRPPGTTVEDLSGMVLAPGIYTSGSTMSIAVDGTVTLDAGGDGEAVWIFQIGSSLTVNDGAQILLINGAQARNVFWVAFASSTLGSDVSFAGSILAGASNSVGTDSVVVGRLLCTTGEISLLSNTITLPL